MPRLRGVAELLQRHLSLQRHHDLAHLGAAARGVADEGGGAGDEARPPSCRSRSVTQSTRPLRWGSCRGRMVSDSDSEATAAGGASCWGASAGGAARARRGGAQGGAARARGAARREGGARREGRRAQEGRRREQEGEADRNGRPLFPGAWAFNLEAHAKWELK